eukprot:PhM_4_TR2406/c0_g1_i1/m.7584
MQAVRTSTCNTFSTNSTRDNLFEPRPLDGSTLETLPCFPEYLADYLVLFQRLDSIVVEADMTPTTQPFRRDYLLTLCTHIIMTGIGIPSNFQRFKFKNNKIAKSAAMDLLSLWKRYLSSGDDSDMPGLITAARSLSHEMSTATLQSSLFTRLTTIHVVSHPNTSFESVRVPLLLFTIVFLAIYFVVTITLHDNHFVEIPTVCGIYFIFQTVLLFRTNAVLSMLLLERHKNECFQSMCTRALEPHHDDLLLGGAGAPVTVGHSSSGPPSSSSDRTGSRATLPTGSPVHMPEFDGHGARRSLDSISSHSTRHSSSRSSHSSHRSILGPSILAQDLTVGKSKFYIKVSEDATWMLDGSLADDNAVIIMCDKVTRKLSYTSRMFCDLLGYGNSKYNLKGMPLDAFCADQKSKDALDKVLASESIVDVEHAIEVNLLSHDCMPIRVRLFVTSGHTENRTENVLTVVLTGRQVHNETLQAALVSNIQYLRYLSSMMYALVSDYPHQHNSGIAHSSGVSLQIPTNNTADIAGGSNIADAFSQSVGGNVLLARQLRLERLIESLRPEKFIATTAAWTIDFQTFSVMRLLGEVSERVSSVYRPQGVLVQVRMGDAVPRTAVWEPETLIDGLVMMSSSLMRYDPTPTKIVLSVDHVPVGDVDTIQLAVQALCDGEGENGIPQEPSAFVFTNLSPHHNENNLAMFRSSLLSQGGHEFKEEAKAKWTIQIPVLERSNAAGDLAPRVINVPRGNHHRMSSLASSTLSTLSHQTPLSTTHLTTVSSKRKLTIHVFEPNIIYAAGIMYNLVTLEHIALHSTSVEGALKMLDDHRPHVVMWDSDSDVGRDHLDKAHSKCDQLGVILVCTSTGGLQQGADFLTKPLRECDLLGFLRTCIRSVEETESRLARYTSKLKDVFNSYNPSEWVRGECIGKGSFGIVYVATVPITGATMAVKVLRYKDHANPDVARAHAEEIATEISILQTMDHPNVIHYFYCERGEDGINVFMEYACNGSLRNFVLKGTMTLTSIIRVLRELISAVAYVHRLGIVHRDIKAANCFLDEALRVKLGDFGAARKISSPSSTSALSGTVTGLKGTLRWMAPEVMRKEPYDQSCDIWSIGCTLIELITRRVPFDHLSDIKSSLISLSKEAQVPYSFPALYSDVPQYAVPMLRSFLDQCLQMDPAMRPSAETLLSHPFLSPATTAAGANYSTASSSSYVVSEGSLSSHSSAGVGAIIAGEGSNNNNNNNSNSNNNSSSSSSNQYHHHLLHTREERKQQFMNSMQQLCDVNVMFEESLSASMTSMRSSSKKWRNSEAGLAGVMGLPTTPGTSTPPLFLGA